jgi:predicted double-glycine peptidase
VRSLLLAAWFFAAAGPAVAEEVSILSAGYRSTVHVTSWRGLRTRTVYIQQYDFSCGSAALASLLNFHYGIPVREDQIFLAMWEAGDQEAIQENGFSLLDMKNFLERHGLAADGFEVDLDTMSEIGVPFITLLSTRGYRHFVVVKGIEPDRVLLGDPARGLIAQPRAAFEASWNRIALIIRDAADQGRASFNPASDWAVEARAPIRQRAQPQALASLLVNLRPSP